MTRLEQLLIVYDMLDNLNNRYVLAHGIKDKRKRDKAIIDIRKDIQNYSSFIPTEIKELFDTQVGSNSLNFQHADDISQCLYILDKQIVEEKDKDF